MSNQDWYSHQDWTTVVVHKTKAMKQMENKNKPKKQNAPGTKEFRKLDGDKNIAKQLQQARCAKKLKQKEVAQRLNVPLSMIQNVENGKAKLNKAFLSRLKKFYEIN